MDYKNMLKIERYFDIYFLLFLILIFLILIKDYLITLLFAAIFVFLVKRFFDFLVNKNINRSVASIFIIFLLFSIIFIPLGFLSISLINQSQELILRGNNFLINLNLNNCHYFFCSTLNSNLDMIKNYLNSFTSRIGEFLLHSIGSIFSSLSSLFLQGFIFILGFYYMLKDGDKFVKYLKKIIPMKREYKNALFKKFEQVSYAVFFGSIFVAILQGVLVGIGFFILKIPSPIFWAVITSIFAIIPFLGTPIIWFPVVVYLIYEHLYLQAIFLFIYGFVIVGLADNVIRPLLIKKQIKINSFIILLSIIGGISVLGFAGIFIGPIIVSLLISVLELYGLDFE